MERKKASDSPVSSQLFDGYVHGMISRRVFWMAPQNSR